MTRLVNLFSIIVLGLTVAAMGCKGEDKTGTEKVGADAQGAADAPVIGEMAEDAAADGEDAIAGELAKLSPADRELVVAQKLCPVSDAPLGSMGPPIKVTAADGRELFICCEHCKEAVDKDFDKFLARVEKKPADAVH